MGKKKGKERSSKEDEDADLSGPSCRHIKKGSDQTLVKKLSGTSDWSSCQDCKNEDTSSSCSPSQETEEESANVWMCLKCGHKGCGRHSENKHAIKHFETPRSDPHCLVVSLDNWAVWCYICDDEVQFSSTGHLAQLLTNLKKLTSADPPKTPHTKIKEEENVSEVEQKMDDLKLEESEEKENKENQPQQKPQKRGAKKDSPVKSSTSSTTGDSPGVSVKGLSNLGNTCFFNAVIQNLSQTQILRETLNQVIEERITLNIEPAASSSLDPVTVQLERPGSLTQTMCHLLNEIQQTKKSVVTPRDLFTQICKKAARFKGFQQQDSQELLRYLLDGMRAEETKRVSTGLMDSLKEQKKGGDEEQLKTLLKEYEKHALPKNFVDQVFGGEMTSTVMCQQCKTVSVVKEMFLDLSLPVSDEAYRKKFQKKAPQKSNHAGDDERTSPALTNGNDTDDIPTGSKYQQKKAKKQAKKQAKQQKRQQKLDNRVTLDSLSSHETKEEGKENGSIDEKANGEGNPLQSNSEDNPDLEQKDPPTIEGEAEDNEDDESLVDCDDSSASNRFTLLSDEQSNDSTLENDKTPDTIQDEDGELADDMEKVTLDEAFLEDSIDAGDVSVELEEECKEYTVVNQDPELAFRSLAPREAPDKQECSVRSCLHQFTEVETLSHNNSLLCVSCTKRQHKGKPGDTKKNVYTEALKQMLISSPPPVLTLHLKRFQQNGFSICKINRHVQFPMLLDLAPFCALKCKAAVEGESQVLYSLYGIVEHSGTMRSGHYTAYVKVRRPSATAASNGLTAQGDIEAPKGSWFHISDTSVQPVSESKVQSCQAYLLFYERIL